MAIQAEPWPGQPFCGQEYPPWLTAGTPVICDRCYTHSGKHYDSVTGWSWW